MIRSPWWWSSCASIQRDWQHFIFKTPLNQEKVYRPSDTAFCPHSLESARTSYISDIYIRYQISLVVSPRYRVLTRTKISFTAIGGLYIRGGETCFTRGLFHGEKKWSGAVPAQGKIMHKSRGLFTTAAARQRIIK